MTKKPIDESALVKETLESFKPDSLVKRLGVNVQFAKLLDITITDMIHAVVVEESGVAIKNSRKLAEVQGNLSMFLEGNFRSLNAERLTGGLTHGDFIQECEGVLAEKGIKLSKSTDVSSPNQIAEIAQHVAEEVAEAAVCVVKKRYQEVGESSHKSSSVVPR